jgi:hypothetical protein
VDARESSSLVQADHDGDWGLLELEQLQPRTRKRINYDDDKETRRPKQKKVNSGDDADRPERFPGASEITAECATIICLRLFRKPTLSQIDIGPLKDAAKAIGVKIGGKSKQAIVKAVAAASLAAGRVCVRAGMPANDVRSRDDIIQCTPF